MIYDYLHDFHHNRHCYHGHDMAKEIDGQEPGTGPDQRARGLWKTANDDFLALQMKLDQRTNRSTKNYDMSDTWWYFRIFCDTLQKLTIPCDILWYVLYFLISFVLHFVASPVATLRRDALLEVCWMRWSRWRRSTFLPWWRNSFKKEARSLSLVVPWGWNDGMMELLGISRADWAI